MRQRSGVISPLYPRRGHAGSALVCAVVLLALSVCGSDGDDRGTAASTPTVGAATTAEFCGGWGNGVTDEARVVELLRDPPPEIADAAAIIVASEEPGGKKDAPAVNEAGDRIFQWVSLNCGDPKQRHVAPPVDAALPGLKLCSASGALPMPESPAGGEQVVIYGEAARADPYDGPMVAVSTAKAGEGDYRGGGDPTPVTVRGTAGTAVPITVFQQTILPELGTMITWTESGHDIGLFGRLWPKSKTADLVALANQLELVDGRFVLPEDARPDGYKEVFAGKPDASWSVVGSSLTGDYHVRYQPTVGTAGLMVDGLHLSAEQFDAFRLFTFPIAQVRIGDHDALFGSVWSKDKGPYVATWRESDGLTVRITGFGVTEEQVRDVAEQTRDLSREEWAAIVGGAKDCPFPTP